MKRLDSHEFGFMTEIERYDAFLRLYRSPDPADAETLDALFESPDPLIPLILLQYVEDIPEKAATLYVVRLIEQGNEVVSRAAMGAYSRSHYPGKARLLKALILSQSPRACRFAVRTLSRAGFAEILPLVLRELPEREGAVRAEMIDALRFIPDRRSAAVLAPLASSQDEPTRWLAVQVLAELQGRVKSLPVSFFLKKTQDPSERVRRAALEALQRYPSLRVAPMILDAALDANQTEDVRVRAVRALAAFPSARWVGPLTRLAAACESQALRLSTEICLRSYPQDALAKGLKPLLDDPEFAVRRQAAALAADFLGGDAEVRAKILALWKGASELEALELVEALKALGGPDAQRALQGAIARSPLLAYAAAGALSTMSGGVRAAELLPLLESASTTAEARQALLDRFVKRGPDAEAAAPLLAALKRLLRDEVTNARYLSVRAFAWYPLADWLEEALDVFEREEVEEVAHAAARNLVRALGRDPMPLVAAAARRPRSGRLAARALTVLLGRGWDASLAERLLAACCAKDGLFGDRPAAAAQLAVHLVERGTATFEQALAACSEREALTLFLRSLAAALRNPSRQFPALPLAGLEAAAAVLGPEGRALFYEALAADGRHDALDRLARALVRETDAGARERGAACLAKLLTEAAG